MDVSREWILALASEIRTRVAAPHESEHWGRRVDLLDRARPWVPYDANAVAGGRSAAATAAAASAATAATAGPSCAGGAQVAAAFASIRA